MVELLLVKHDGLTALEIDLYPQNGYSMDSRDTEFSTVLTLCVSVLIWREWGTTTRQWVNQSVPFSTPGLLAECINKGELERQILADTYESRYLFDRNCNKTTYLFQVGYQRDLTWYWVLVTAKPGWILT